MKKSYGFLKPGLGLYKRKSKDQYAFRIPLISQMRMSSVVKEDKVISVLACGGDLGQTPRLLHSSQKKRGGFGI